MSVVLRKKHRFWNAQRLAQLELLAPDMTSEEAADYFHVSAQGIREICKTYGFKLHPPRRQKQKSLNAQESIALFKLQYQNQPINQLLTKNWRHYEQI